MTANVAQDLNMESFNVVAPVGRVHCDDNDQRMSHRELR